MVLTETCSLTISEEEVSEIIKDFLKSKLDSELFSNLISIAISSSNTSSFDEPSKIEVTVIFKSKKIEI